MTVSSFRPGTGGMMTGLSSSTYEPPAGQVVVVDFRRKARMETSLEEHESPNRNIWFSMIFVGVLTALAIYVFQTLISATIPRI